MIIEKECLQNCCILEDGRRLIYDIYGDKEGFPYFYFHGYPCSRLEASCLHEEAAKKNIKLISIDRPGLGLSDFQEDRVISDWPRDVLCLSKELNLKKFGIVSYSAGSAYALACGCEFPDKLVKIVLLAALGAVDFQQPGLRKDHKFVFKIANKIPILYQGLFWWTRIRRIKSKNGAKKFYRSNLSNLNQRDRELLKTKDILNKIVEIQRESCSRGLKGLVHEAKLLGKPWGINLQSLSSNLRIYLWHGTGDLIAPVTGSREIESLLPKCEVQYKEDDGHFSLIFNHHEEILNEMRSVR